MSIFTVNHGEAGGFEPVPPGTYEAVISEVKVKTSSTGNPMISVTLTIRDDVDQKAQKRKLFDNLVQTEKAMFKFQQYAKAIEMPEGTSIPTLEAFAQELLYKPVKAKVSNKMEEFNGKEELRDRIDFIDVAAVPYGGQAGASNPFSFTTGAEGDDGPAPWEQGGGEAEAEEEAPKRGSRSRAKKPEISEDDLPF